MNLRRISCILLSAALLCCAFSAGGEETEQEAYIYVLTGTGVERVPLETEEDTAGAENLSEVRRHGRRLRGPVHLRHLGKRHGPDGPGGL